jgi:hypothetical protein
MNFVGRTRSKKVASYNHNSKENPLEAWYEALSGEASTTIFEEIHVKDTHTDRVSSPYGVDPVPAEPSLPPLNLLFHPLILLQTNLGIINVRMNWFPKEYSII